MVGAPAFEEWPLGRAYELRGFWIIWLIRQRQFRHKCTYTPFSINFNFDSNSTKVKKKNYSNSEEAHA